MEVSVTEFLKHLEASGLAAAEDLADLRAEQDAAGVDGTRLAARLVNQDKLTAYQAHELLAGRSRGFFLEKYKILEPIGQGGHGTVFKGEHTTLRRPAAIKVLRRKGAADPDTLTRFQLEARAAAQLEHENIVRVYDVGQEGDTHYIAMEYVAGLSLAQLIRDRGRLPVSECAAVIYQIALGLEHAFQRGVIHRDIKPSNIVVTPEGTAKILDMGLARLFGEAADNAMAQSTLTQTGRVMGTVDYIAPEQAEDSHRADTRSDIYAMGCTLYQCLSGQVPFPEGTVMQKLLKHRDHNPTPIDVLCPDMPAALAATVRRMMTKRPADRFQTPSEVADALRPLLPQVPVTVSDLAPIVLDTGSGLEPCPESPTMAHLPRASDPDGDAPPSRDSPWTGTAAEPPSDDLGVSLALCDLSSPPIATRVAATTAVSEQPEVSSRRHDSLPALQDSEALSTDHASAVAELPEISTRAEAGAFEALESLELGSELPATITFSDLRQRRWTKVHTAFAVLFAAAIALTASGVVWNQVGQATVVVHWPASEREKGTVEIEGRPPVPVPATGALEFLGPAGRRRVRLVRPGYEPFEQTVTLGRGARESVEPKWERTVQSVRQEKLSQLETEIQQVLRGGPTEQRVKPLRDKLVDLLRQNWEVAERRRAAALMPLIEWPIDSLDPEQIPPYELQSAGGGKAENAPAALVGVVGDGRLKHWDRVWTVAFSPNSPLLASGSEDGTVKLWDHSTGEELNTFVGHSDAVRSLAFSPADSKLASAGDDGRVILWDLANRELALTLDKHKGAVQAVAFSPDGQTLASAGADRTIKLWDSAKGTELKTLEGHGDEVHAVAFASDGQTLVSAGNDNAVKLWDVASGTEQRTLERNGSAIACLARSPDGRTLALGNKDGVVELWNLSANDRPSTLARHTGGVVAVAFSPDGQSLASGGVDRVLRVWDLSTGRDRQHMSAHTDSIHSVAFSPDGRTVASGGGNGLVRLWNVATGQEQISPNGRAAWIMAAAFSPDGQTLSLGHRDGTVTLRDLTSGEDRYVVQAHIDAVNCLVFSPDSQTLASGGGDGNVRLWEVASGQGRRVLEGHTGKVFNAAFSPDGKTLATGSADRTVILWDVAAGQARQKLEGHTNWVHSVAFSPSGQLLASGSGDDKVKLWDSVKGKDQQTLGGHIGGVFSLAFHPDGRTLVSAGGADHFRIKLWDLTSTRQQQSFEGHVARVTSVAFSPSGETLASSAQDGTVRVWNARTGRLLQTFPLGPARGQVVSVSFSPEGRHLAATNSNGTVYILRLASYQPPQRP